jgi:predicted Zn-dependent protease
MTKRKTQIVAEDAFDELEEEMPEGFSNEELDDLAFQMFEAATSRRQTEYEYEADMMGVIYAYRAGYNPHGLASVLKSIKSMTSRDFWHPESNWQYDAIEDRSEKVSAFISAKLTKNSDWNVENRQRFCRVFK